ncbi:MAG: glycosyltransferase [Microbacteriaceae bacterium]|nr:glycosyltransferase [Microbacteriaceae bacterium]
MILICVNELAGPSGYHKSVVETTNALHRAGYPVAVLSFLGTADGAGRAIPGWALDLDVPVYALQTLPAEGGRLLHRNYHPVFHGTLAATRFEYTENQLAALRQINAALTEDDTIVFTAPIPAYVFNHAIDGQPRRAKTVLQIHNDYHFHDGLWKMLMESRSSIDKLQTVSNGLRAQFIPTFAESDVVFIPNLPGTGTAIVEPANHDRINVALPASIQHRKNQLDAIRALALVEDDKVELTLWGNVNRLNPYYIAVQQLIESLNLADRVHMPGFGSESDIYSTADIVLMTSLSEGFGYPLIEAGVHSLPAVAFDFDFGPRDVIEDDNSGYIVPVGDVDLLADRLSRLAADAALRAAFGRRAREIFDERFSTEAVVEQYRRLLGSPAHRLDLTGLFATDEQEEIALDAISHGVRHLRGRTVHEIFVSSELELHDVQIDNGKRVTSPVVTRLPTGTKIELHAEGNEVVSYTTTHGGARHYLANTTAGGGFEVLPYLRSDADYGSGTPAVEDTIFANLGGSKRPSTAELASVFGSLARNAPRDVAWKIRQLAASARTASHRDPATAATVQQAAPTASEPADAPRSAPTAAPPQNSLLQAAGLPKATMRSLGGMAASISKNATRLTIQRLATNTPAPARCEITRHPVFPTTSGVDNFGTPINRPGGVQVRNAGSTTRPTVSISGEYDWLLLRDAVGERRITAPFSYAEFFERICAAEREHGLFDITTRDGIHVWELGRSALIIQLAEAAGIWGKNDAIGAPVNDVYTGPKRLTTASPSRRVVFDYARRGQSGYRTAAYRDNETLFVVQPEVGGYPEVNDTNLVYPFHEFNQWRQGWRRRWTQLRAPEVDARPFEDALGKALGIKVDLGSHLRSRLLKFIDERDFFTPVFERVQPEEVLIASSHWWAGIAAAASRSGAVVSDIQYALTSRYAPSFWFGARPHYGASRFYTWSDYWAARTNVYEEHVVVPRQQPEFAAAAERDPGDPKWDVCVISQPRVLRRILAFVQDLVRERSELKVVIAPHPAQRPIMERELAAAGLSGAVTIAPEDTLTTIQQSAICVGTFSTSLWEAAALNRPTYVIPVPGHEETLDDVEAGLFRLANSPHDLVPYEVPGYRNTIFGYGS